MNGRHSIFAVDAGVVQTVQGVDIRDVAIDDPSLAGTRVPRVPPPPGAELSRIATISDLHIGEPGFGILPKVREARGLHPDHFTVRAARAAIAEAAGWGAQLIVVKGDISWTARPGHWEKAAEVLAASPVPVVAVMGNHDMTARGQDGRPWLEDAGLSLIVDAENPAASIDVPGLRLAIADTSPRHRGKGHVTAAARDELAALVAATPAGSGSMVVLHHYPNRFRQSTRYPQGIAFDDAERLIAAMREAGPPALVTCGHSHRHRRYTRGGVAFSEVGSTKDYPGVWAGYVVHEGGIRQVVRRIAEPSVVEWTERTKRSCLGLWGAWTPGLLRWRCFSLPWPT